jgi:tetratricopeptide (TPR) repeat protein
VRAGESSSSFGNFVGRERELAELRAALEDASSGRGQLFMLSGEPGIGKTRFADELAGQAASRGMRVVWGRCWEGGGAPAYWPWIQVIRGCVSAADQEQRRRVLEPESASSMVETVAQIVPELHAFAPRSIKPPMAPRPAPETQFRLFDSVATLLKDFARQQPLLIVLDDLHDADYSSLTMMRLIAQGLAGARILLVGTYRDVEVRRSPDLSKQIGDLSREGHSISLAGLSPPEIARLVAARAGQTPSEELVARLHGATAGNPLFVDGVVRMLIADGDGGLETATRHQFKIPDTLREAIRRRLEMLPDEARSLLQVAAAIGNEFEADLCVRVAGVSRDKVNALIDEASADGIVILVAPARYRFAHALIRAAMYDALDSNTRIGLHGKIAETIEEVHAKDLRPHLAELAHYFGAAGATEKAIKYSNRAAKAARRVFAYADSAMHWREALALSADQNDARQAEMLYNLGTVEAFFVDPAAGFPHLEAALKLYRELKSDENVARVNATIGLALTAQADFAPGMNVRRALDYFREAQAWKGEWSDLFGLGWLHQGLATALFQEVRIDEAIVAVQQARATWERASNPAWVMSASVHAQFLTINGRHREAAALFDEVSRVVHEIADPEIFRSAMWYAGWSRMIMRDPIEARRLFTIGMERPGLSPHQRERHFEFLALTENSLVETSREQKSSLPSIRLTRPFELRSRYGRGTGKLRSKWKKACWSGRGEPATSGTSRTA